MINAWQTCKEPRPSFCTKSVQQLVGLSFSAVGRLAPTAFPELEQVQFGERKAYQKLCVPYSKCAYRVTFKSRTNEDLIAPFGVSSTDLSWRK